MHISDHKEFNLFTSLFPFLFLVGVRGCGEKWNGQSDYFVAILIFSHWSGNGSVTVHIHRKVNMVVVVVVVWWMAIVRWLPIRKRLNGGLPFNNMRVGWKCWKTLSTIWDLLFRCSLEHGKTQFLLRQNSEAYLQTRCHQYACPNKKIKMEKKKKGRYP